MANQFQELAGILGKELALFKELGELLDQETRPLVEYDLPRIEEITKAKETLDLRMKILEQARLETIRLLAAELGLAPAEMSLRTIASRAPMPDGPRLARLRDALVALTEELKRKVETNGKLVSSSIKTVQALQALIVRSIEEPATYEEAGRIRQADPVYTQNGRRV